MIVKFEVDFEEGQIVYLKTDKEQLPRLVIGYELRSDRVRYDLISGTFISTHSAIEISDTKDFTL